MRRLGLMLMIVLGSSSAAAPAADHIVLQLGWAAEPEFGGFFQARQAGIYAAHGLDVDIVLGNAQVNATQLLLAGRADFIIGPNTYALNALRRGYPLVVVAAIFQKSPNVLIAHADTNASASKGTAAGTGGDGLASLRGRPLMIAFSDLVTFWPFLKQRYGFSDEELRPYNFNSGPFLADPAAVQQGYMTEEPYVLRAAGAAIKVFPLADYGYDVYGMTIITTPATIAARPGVVEQFVSASLEGWARYMGGDDRPANDFIKANNSHIDDGQIAFAVDTMRCSGLLLSGDAAQGGIGAMSDRHWAAMFAQMSGLGLYPASLEYQKAYSLKFLARVPP